MKAEVTPCTLHFFVWKMMEVLLVLGLLLGFGLFTFLLCLNGRMQIPGRLAAMTASAILSLPAVLGGLTVTRPGTV